MSNYGSISNHKYGTGFLHQDGRYLDVGTVETHHDWVWDNFERMGIPEDFLGDDNVGVACEHGWLRLARDGETLYVGDDEDGPWNLDPWWSGYFTIADSVKNIKEVAQGSSIVIGREMLRERWALNMGMSNPMSETSSTGAMNCAAPASGFRRRAMSANNFLKCFEPEDLPERKFDKGKKKKKKMEEHVDRHQLNSMTRKVELLAGTLSKNIAKRNIVSRIESHDRTEIIETTHDMLERLRGSISRLRDPENGRTENKLLRQADVALLSQIMESLTRVQGLSFRLKTVEEDKKDFSAACDLLKQQMIEAIPQVGNLLKAYKGDFQLKTDFPDNHFEGQNPKILENRFLNDMLGWCDDFSHRWAKKSLELTYKA